MSGYTQAGLETLAHAVENETRAANERNRTRGLTAHADRQSFARAEGLKMAIEVTGFQAGSGMDEQTLAVYARRFANFILTGDMV